MREQMGATAKA